MWKTSFRNEWQRNEESYKVNIEAATFAASHTVVTILDFGGTYLHLSTCNIRLSNASLKATI